MAHGKAKETKLEIEFDFKKPKIPNAPAYTLIDLDKILPNTTILSITAYRSGRNPDTAVYVVTEYDGKCVRTTARKSSIKTGEQIGETILMDVSKNVEFVNLDEDEETLQVFNMSMEALNSYSTQELPSGQRNFVPLHYGTAFFQSEAFTADRFLAIKIVTERVKGTEIEHDEEWVVEQYKKLIKKYEEAQEKQDD